MTLLLELERRWTDKLGARSVQLLIRSVEPPGEHRYEKLTKIIRVSEMSQHLYT